MTQPVQPGYGQITGYEPISNGQGYRFHLASGGYRDMPAQAGESVRKRIDEMQAAAGASGAPVNVPLPDAGPPAAAAAPGAGNFDPIASAKGGGEIGVRRGDDPANPMNYVVRTPGRAATKGGMQARGMTTQGGYAVDEQFLDQMETSQVRSAAIQEQGIERGMQAAAEREGFMKAQQAQAERDMAVQAHENAVKQQRMGEFQAKYEKAEQDYTNFHAEKEAEANSPKAKLATFLGTLSSALGALGAGMARTPNFAAEAVARHNEMQLRREEAELRVRKDAKDSLLGRLQQEMGSLDLAKTAYRAMQAKQATIGWEMLAQKEQNQERQQQLMQVAELQNRDYLKWREQYVRGSEGEVTRTFQYVPGQSASRGGYRAPTIEELQGLQNLRKGDAEIEKTRAEAARGSAAEERQVPHERTAAISGMSAAINAADRIEKNIRERGMSEQTTFDDPVSGPHDKFNEAVSSVVGGKTKPANDALRADTFEMARGLQLAYGKSDNDALMANQQAAGSATGADRLRAAQSTKRRAIENIRTELGSLPPKQQQKVLSTLPPDVQKALTAEGGE